jgi:hypothetical protein
LHLDTKEEASADLCVDAADFDPENPPDMSAFLENSEDEDEDEEDESEEEDDYEEDLEVCCAASFACRCALQCGPFRVSPQTAAATRTERRQRPLGRGRGG